MDIVKTMHLAIESHELERAKSATKNCFKQLLEYATLLNERSNVINQLLAVLNDLRIIDRVHLQTIIDNIKDTRWPLSERNTENLVDTHLDKISSNGLEILHQHILNMNNYLKAIC